MTLDMLYELLGYLASITIAISLMIKSFIRFRVINTIGSLLFVIVYGFFIKSYPVALLNSICVIANVYYLLKFWFHKEYYRMVPFAQTSEFLQEFIIFYKNDIQKYYPHFHLNFEKDLLCLYILRDMIPAGIIVCDKKNDGSAEVLLDYVTQEFRDAKAGHFLYFENNDYFHDLGINRFFINDPKDNTKSYLDKMGFIEKENKIWEKVIDELNIPSVKEIIGLE